MTPLRTKSAGDKPATAAPRYLTEPFVISPRSDSNRLEIDLSVVDLPAPLPPRSAVMPPFGNFQAYTLQNENNMIINNLDITDFQKRFISLRSALTFISILF